MTKRISKKISAKTVFGNMANIVAEYLKPAGVGVEVPLFRVIGTAEKLRPFTSDFGAGVAIVGEFEAVNMLTGESTIGTEAFFPGELNEMIAAAMKSTTDGGGKSIDFAFEVLGVYAPASSTQYTYLVKSLMAVAESDRIKALKASVPAFTAAGLLPPVVQEIINAKRLALAAPQGSPAPAAIAAPETKPAETKTPEASAATGGKKK